jgi:hypothetical protein
MDDGYTLRALDVLLELLKKYDQKITFFVVFKLEELYPGLLAKILQAGHEVAWHSYSHFLINNQRVLTEELKMSQSLLETYHVQGFQAPNIVFCREGYEILRDYNFLYSSSVYGNPNYPYLLDNVVEIPVSVSRNINVSIEKIVWPVSMKISTLSQFGLPYGSSYFWSILGKKYYFRKIKGLEEQNLIANLFVHDWQILTPDNRAYRTDVNLFCNPFFAPYRINVRSVFEFLLANFRFCKFQEHYSLSRDLL